MNIKVIIGIILVGLGIFLIIIGFRNKNTKEVIPRNDLQVQGNHEVLQIFSAGEYTINTQASSMTWEGKSIVKTHKGSLELTSGDITASDTDVSGTLVFDMNTLRSDGGKGLDADLKSNNFFMIETYPTARLDIDNYSGGNIMGNLTIKDTTQFVSFPVTITQPDDDSLNLSGTVSFDRTLWDINYRSESFFKDLGDATINDEIFVTINLVFKK